GRRRLERSCRRQLGWSLVDGGPFRDGWFERSHCRKLGRRSGPGKPRGDDCGHSRNDGESTGRGAKPGVRGWLSERRQGSRRRLGGGGRTAELAGVAPRGWQRTTETRSTAVSALRQKSKIPYQINLKRASSKPEFEPKMS